jgi:hypothetical protein
MPPTTKAAEMMKAFDSMRVRTGLDIWVVEGFAQSDPAKLQTEMESKYPHACAMHIEPCAASDARAPALMLEPIDPPPEVSGVPACMGVGALGGIVGDSVLGASGAHPSATPSGRSAVPEWIMCPSFAPTVPSSHPQRQSRSEADAPATSTAGWALPPTAPLEVS